MQPIIRVGVVTFSSSPQYHSTIQKESHIQQAYTALCKKLSSQGFDICAAVEDCCHTEERYGICCDMEVDDCAAYLIQHQADCLILQVSQWSDPILACELTRRTKLPVALYVSRCKDWAGETIASAIIASLREYTNEPNCIKATRFDENSYHQMSEWIRGVGASHRMQKGKILMWGGMYGANIPYCREDSSLLERKFVREISIEEELILFGNAQTILQKDFARVASFQNWLEQHGCLIQMDGCMLSKQSLELQIAQYLAARDRIACNTTPVLAATVKCHYAASTFFPGCTECIIPAFLPMGNDSEGKKFPVPVACEGDIKGALTLALLAQINPDAPPLFGDVLYSEDGTMLVKNCGAHPVYWATRTPLTEKNLCRVQLMPQSHGASGAAVRFIAAEGDVTIARLFRIGTRFFMYLGKGSIAIQKDYQPSKHGTNWPQAMVQLPVHADRIFQTLPCNHICLTDGDYTAEIEAYCRYMGIYVVRCDQDSALDAFQTMISYEFDERG